ncbi:MFS transporter [Runella slithyformis]|uniref:Major facilitator superfamily MFS_1 n=1 Tax=Runella slithyformis (strain ATCC 29530 / DSM 19594 / LMG 11500 / NCIMB 11436 / LSU 4) TaxID=761193 RepID=A0A7U4E8M8_RUNSL|nr:MFS transporter [Runella slithyformis]AEI51873.1 major facilitator superfamily MFS_1 [Runella slithyformis DSM 19594]
MQSYWKVKLSIFLNYFVFAILLNSVGTVILQVQHTYNVSEISASILEAFKDLSIAVVSFSVASYINKLGYKNAMLVALGFNAFICLLMPSVHSFGMTKVVFAVAGAGFALIKVSVYGTIGLVTADKKEHISLMNFIESFFMVGILAGYFLFSGFMDESTPTAWLKVYYLLGGIALIAFVLLITTPLDESSLKTEAAGPFRENFADMFRLIVLPLVLVFIICAFTYVLIEQSIMSWLPTFNSKVLHLPNALSIQMASLLAIATALGRFLAGVVLKKLNWLFVLTGCLVISAALVLIALPLAANAVTGGVTGWGNAPLAAFIFPMIGLFLAPVYPAINSLILSSLPVNQHGLMSGLIVIFSALGGTTGSLITGYVFEHYGGQTAFYFSLIPIGLLIIALLFFSRLQGKNGAIEIHSVGGH